MTRHTKLNTKLNTSHIRKSLLPFQEWCRAHGLPEDSQNSYEEYLSLRKSKQAVSTGGPSRQKPKACRRAPRYDPKAAAKHKRAVQEQLSKISPPAASATQAIVTTPPRLRARARSFAPSPSRRLRAEAPSFAPSPPTSRGSSPWTSPPGPIPPPSPGPSDSASDKGAWAPWDRDGSSVALADCLRCGFPEYAGLIMAPGRAAGGLPGTANRMLGEEGEENGDGEEDLEPAVCCGRSSEGYLLALDEEIDALWERLEQREMLKW
ncbi:MAG: hypothetical protein FRX48_00777 [Lasallia pustulata]|uniref:Uncharacterized protein n=1 Tax=Lasallia pustulata TaxID=136370 RepID=A0A5M8Q1S9_9LECA|nr:MAG: hypothetical protein FRX48_00777 [Lasallia pustulata]